MKSFRYASTLTTYSRLCLYLSFVALFIGIQKASAASVLQVPMERLFEASALVLKGEVLEAESGAGGRFVTRYTLDVATLFRGKLKDTSTTSFSFEIIGGSVLGKTLAVPGVPRLEKGQNVILFLEKTPSGYIFTGLGQGVFRLKPGSDSLSDTRIDAVRDFSGMHFVDLATDSGSKSNVAQTGSVIELTRLEALMRQWQIQLAAPLDVGVLNRGGE